MVELATALELYKSSPSTDFNRMMGIGREEHCRYVWSYRISDDNSPWRAIGHRQSGKKTTTLPSFYLDASIGRDCSIDCFISPNQFFDWRNTKQLASLHANWLEIDINTPAGTIRENKVSLTAEEECQVINEVFIQLLDAQVPLPTGYVLSGSGGVHLYWAYEGVSAYKWRVSAWRDIASKLVSNLKGGKKWHVDLGASKDPARVLRMPGTVHGSTRRKVQFYSGGTSYKFDLLAKSLGVKINKAEHLKVVKNFDMPSKKKTLPKKETTSTHLVKSGKHTIGQWWFKTYTHILHHINNNPIKEGKRDSAAFILFVALRHMQSEEAAFQRIREINKRSIGLTDDELIRYLKTARKTLYKYKKDSLSEYLERQLGMNSDFLYQAKDKLTPEQVKVTQRESAADTARKKAKSTLQKIISAAKDLTLGNKRLTQSSVAAICGRSVRTVRRYWDIVLSDPVIRSASIYSPPQEWPVDK